MTTFLPLDSNDQPMQVLRYRRGGAHHIGSGVSSARNTVGFDPCTSVISVYTSTPAFINFGDSAVTATSGDHYLPSGISKDIAIGGGQSAHYTHMAVLAVGASGDVYISELE